MSASLLPGTIRRAWNETPSLRGMLIEAPDAVRTSHARAGQYVKARAGALEGYLALANPPGSSSLEFLVKRGAPFGDALAALGEGAQVELSTVQGKGYPLDEQTGRNLLLFAAGSGISPIRSVLGEVMGARSRFGRVQLYYGQRHPDEFAYRDEQAAWARADIAVVPVVSGDAASWTGARGHVQSALLASPPPIAIEQSAAFLCGMKGMVTGVTEALNQLGMPREQIFLNF